MDNNNNGINNNFYENDNSNNNNNNINNKGTRLRQCNLERRGWGSSGITEKKA